MHRALKVQWPRASYRRPDRLWSAVLRSGAPTFGWILAFASVVCGAQPDSKFRQVAPHIPPLIEIDESLVARAGLERITGEHLIVYSDLRDRDDVPSLPEVFDAAAAELARYFDISPDVTDSWRLTACVMVDRDRFVQAGLVPSDLPDFLAGYQHGSQIWVYPQMGEYYLRHLVLHEAVHAFMTHFLGGTGPAWYSEGIAELVALHRWDGNQLSLAADPRTRDEVPYWGRVRLLRQAVSAGRGKSLADVFAMQSQEFRQVESYAWAWAACKFLADHPLTGTAFHAMADRLSQPIHETQARLDRQLQPHLPLLELEWTIFLAEMEYGYLIEPMAIRDARQVATQRANEQAAVEVDSQYGWQRTTWEVAENQTITIAASGEFQIAHDGEPWTAQANGVTLEYHQGKPLGRLIACVMPELAPGQPTLPIEGIDVGHGATVQAPRAGVVWLRLNDAPSKLSDNVGSVRVALVAK